MVESEISVLIADDDRLVGESVSLCLEQAGISVLGLATSGYEALETAFSMRPDVLLLDFRMPGPDASHILAAIRRRDPRMKVIVFSAWNRPEYLAKAIVHRADGYLTKEIGLDTLVQTIRHVAATRMEYSQGTIEAAIDVLRETGSAEHVESQIASLWRSEFTPQELRILTLMAEGLNNREISALINLKPNTVKTHIRNVLQKLEVDDRTNAAVWAIRHGISTDLR